MLRKIIDSLAAFWTSLLGPSQSGVTKRLTADTTAHKAGETTNRIASESTLATNVLHRRTTATRRARVRLRAALLGASATLTARMHALATFRTDPAVIANAESAKDAREYQHSGKAHFLDIRVWRALVVIIAIIVAIADFGFMFSVYRELFVLSVANFEVAQLGEWAVAATLPLLFPVVVIALAEVAGKTVGRGRARRMHPERAEKIFGAKLTEYEKSWGAWWATVIYAGAAVGLGAFFFVMAIHRFGAAAEDAGLSFPAWALAFGYGLLPIVALLVDIASRDVVLEHDRKTLQALARNEKARIGLENEVLQAHVGLQTAWLALKERIDRILQDANQSIVLFEQLVTDAYARTRAIGALAPFAESAGSESGLTAGSGSNEPSIPVLVQHRSLSMRIMRWVTNELDADLELLRLFAPDGNASEHALRRLAQPDAVDAAESGAPVIEGEDEAHDVIEFPDRRVGDEAVS